VVGEAGHAGWACLRVLTMHYEILFFFFPFGAKSSLLAFHLSPFILFSLPSLLVVDDLTILTDERDVLRPWL
jgi:hypothetical protein